MNQATLSTPFRASGVGLHGGQPAEVTVSPAGPGHGIRFVRADRPGSADVPAHMDRVTSSRLATTISSGSESVATVEHLLSALVAHRIDNARISVSGPEVPVLDGSAKRWVELLTDRQEQDARARTIRVLRPVEVKSGVRSMRLLPSDGLEIDATIDFEHARIGVQKLAFRVDPDDYDRDIAWARTFGFLDEVEALRANGFARGGGLENAVVFAPDGTTLNELRAPDEPVRHKVLDILGDVALLGCRLQGHIQAIRPGHGMTLALLRALRADPAAFERV
ncbi:MAG: UDP-3-O-[3-hydroxymyristoyl] N-acetylglucosamine deacetylase [Proteobacteria bacterium]|nr:UDP-3-O-[3-hydroxymyristoyl] N-acetylglucosamine deacetylase [Pseudomonadota bacterium]MCP4917578.1 UDP-3-O-[3-hydroxymyristoyl] N-acetylglucosamine deacetylase [Pseudomonadota bacterium]